MGKFGVLEAQSNPAKQTTPTTKGKVVRRKINLAEFPVEINSVSKPCQITGYSGQQFNGFRRNYLKNGALGPIECLPEAKRTAP